MVRRTSNEKQQEHGSWMQHTDARSQDAKPSGLPPSLGQEMRCYGGRAWWVRRDEGSCQGYLGSRERSEERGRMSQSKKPVWADRASNWEEGLSLGQEGGTCQRRGDTVGGDCHCCLGSRAAREGLPTSSSLGRQGQGQTDRQTKGYSPSGNRCFRTLSATDYRYEKQKPLEFIPQLKKLQMVGLPMKERLLHCDAFIPRFPKPYERTMTCTLKPVRGSNVVLHGGRPGSNWAPGEEAFAVWVSQNRGHLLSHFSLESMSFSRLGETFVLFFFLS